MQAAACYQSAKLIENLLCTSHKLDRLLNSNPDVSFTIFFWLAPDVTIDPCINSNWKSRTINNNYRLWILCGPQWPEDSNSSKMVIQYNTKNYFMQYKSWVTKNPTKGKQSSFTWLTIIKKNAQNTVVFVLLFLDFSLNAATVTQLLQLWHIKQTKMLLSFGINILTFQFPVDMIRISEYST